MQENNNINEPEDISQTEQSSDSNTSSTSDIIETAKKKILSNDFMKFFPHWFTKLFAIYSTLITLVAFIYCWIFATFTSAFIATICLAGTNAATIFVLMKICRGKFANNKSNEESSSVEEHLLAQHELISNEINPKISKLEAEIEDIKANNEKLTKAINKHKAQHPDDGEQWFDKPFPNPDEVLYPPAEEETSTDDNNKTDEVENTSAGKKSNDKYDN